LGIAALENKIVQQALVTILNQIYEVDFKGFSYGFRPGRGPHQALDAPAVGHPMEEPEEFVVRLTTCPVAMLVSVILAPTPA
jgi:hypothetical protein